MPETDPTKPKPTGGQPGVDPSRRLDRSGTERPVRHRLRLWVGHRARYLVTGLIALLGIGVAGGVTAMAGGGPDRMSVPDDASARSAAAQRADRSEREDGGPHPPTISASPTLSPGPTPTPTAATSTGQTAGSQAGRRGTSTPAAKPTAKRRPAAWVDPLPGAEPTSCFGMRWGVLHAGIDLAMPTDTPIRAAGTGTVVAAGWAYTGYGISVVIDHGNGYLTHYAHQSRTVTDVGQRVSAGEVIGFEGATGDVTGPHLHFEVHNGLWNQIDPAPWMRARGVDLGC